MREDPRCPHCEEKVSATAAWCMHCGRNFESPVNAGSDGALDDLLGSAVTDAGASGSSASGEVGDLGDVLAVLDRSSETRQGLVMAVAGATWVVLSVATGANGVVALLASAAFGYYLFQLDDAATVLVRSVYGAAALVVALQLFVAVSGGGGLPALLDGGALVVVVGLVVAGQWLEGRVESR
ncbi:hypothetical protein [Halomicrobium salinisoli]|uniref:hypothetical protein n=1 Tax=Halomicrobium salinisoli TaxID=2878391 RepID=UPI001CF059BC|nr:hypothetical protein [Halomicrobium salinisoli]